MLQIDLSPDVEIRLKAQARASGVEAERYAEKLIENAVRIAPVPPRRRGANRDMEAFFRGMAAYSDKIPPLPDEAFTRESFYRDDD